MTKKQLRFTTGLYVFCALIWTFNFFINWHVDGRLTTSTILYGISALCFTIAAVLNIIRVRRLWNTKGE